MMSDRRIIVVGGGAAGFFAAITCAEAAPDARVTLLEKGPRFLSKVRISGGGRCNVTHASFDPRELCTHYPRGAQTLRGPFNVFQASDTVAWFETRGVKLKTEKDGRIFPVSDSSQTIIDCLVHSAKHAGVELSANCGVERVCRKDNGGFGLEMRGSGELSCDQLMLATGGCRSLSGGQLALGLGHSLEPPVPSLFTFHIETAWLRELAGISLETVEVSVPGLALRERGPLLVTHHGLSGPVILRLSAWGARPLHGVKYQFPLRVNWLPQLDTTDLTARLESLRIDQAARLVINTPLAPLPFRLWERLVVASGTARDIRWAGLSRSAQHQLVLQLGRTQFQVTGKTLNQDEFVTCGGVRAKEINWKTMESSLCSGLYFGGELLDIDGLTGGFNFQAAWTTGWIAGQSMAARSK